MSFFPNTVIVSEGCTDLVQTVGFLEYCDLVTGSLDSKGSGYSCKAASHYRYVTFQHCRPANGQGSKNRLFKVSRIGEDRTRGLEEVREFIRFYLCSPAPCYAEIGLKADYNLSYYTNLCSLSSNQISESSLEVFYCKSL